MSEFSYKTPSAEAEDLPARIVALHLHLGEVFEVYTCVRFYCERAEPYFDSAPHYHSLGEIIKILRDSIEKADPEYFKSMIGPAPKAPEFPPRAPRTEVVREIHHHHYHTNPNPHFRPAKIG